MPEALASPAAGRSSVQASFWAAGLFCLALLLIFHQTTWSIIAIWMRSDTYVHGFLILPISLWLVWNQRDSLRTINPRSEPWLAILVIPPGFAWMLAWLVDVLVVQQLALVAMLVIGVWAILGRRLARALAFPLLFLFFAVPMGEALIPPMMEFTATSTVRLIQMSGIPVYRDGLYFSLPSGNWSVVEACSGARYLLASITLGVLYAYLTFRSAWRRILFVLASAIVPVFANSARAYIIVMLGHFSNMTIATGVDHLVYGWIFFGIVMFLLFSLGALFREDGSEAPGDNANQRIDLEESDPALPSRLLATTLMALLLVVLGPLLISATEARSDANPVAEMVMPRATGSWHRVADPDWDADALIIARDAAYYTEGGQTLGLFTYYRDGSADDDEVVDSSTRYFQKGADLNLVSRSKLGVQLGKMPIFVEQTQLRGATGEFLVWSWYRIGNLHTSNNYLAKLSEARTGLGFGPPGSYRILVALPLRETVASTQASLQNFLEEHGKQLDQSLNRVIE